MPSFPGEDALRAERSAFVGTVSALAPDLFETGPTLCAGWAPRDVLADHRVVPTDDVGRAVGVGRVVRGPAVALGLWLSGRDGVEPGLTFA